MSLDKKQDWLEVIQEEGKPEFKLFDMLAHEIDQLAIKKFQSGNCFVVDKTNNYYNGFILSKNSHTQTECRIDFYASKSTTKHVPRPLFQVVNISDGSIKESNKGNDKTRRISFQNENEGRENFWKLIQFFAKFKDVIDLGDFSDKFKVVTRESIVNTIQAQDSQEAKKQEILEITQQVGIPSSDLALYIEAKNREDDLTTFKSLLDDANYHNTYRANNIGSIKGNGTEAIWHHFLSNHQWVFGLNLDLRFIENFADEQSLGNPTTENSGNPVVDMIGFTDYTVLIELKTPDVNIFTEAKSSEARTNTWSFESSFIEGFSQCLAQKSDWNKNARSKDFTIDGEVINQDNVRTVDPKVIFLYGNKEREIPLDSSTVEVKVKRDTLERFAKNNRNVEFISFDELFKRAEYIVKGKQ